MGLASIVALERIEAMERWETKKWTEASNSAGQWFSGPEGRAIGTVGIMLYGALHGILLELRGIHETLTAQGDRNGRIRGVASKG